MDIFRIRKDALRYLIRQAGGNSAFAVKLQLKNGSSLSQVTSPAGNRKISEKVARNYETKLGLPNKWMDEFNEFAPIVHGDKTKRIERIKTILDDADEEQLAAIEYALFLDLL